MSRIKFTTWVIAALLVAGIAFILTGYLGLGVFLMSAAVALGITVYLLR